MTAMEMQRPPPPCGMDRHDIRDDGQRPLVPRGDAGFTHTPFPWTVAWASEHVRGAASLALCNCGAGVHLLNLQCTAHRFGVDIEQLQRTPGVFGRARRPHDALPLRMPCRGTTHGQPTAEEGQPTAVEWEQRVSPQTASKVTGPQRTGCTCSPPCDFPSGCCFFTGPWTVTRSSLRMLRRVAAFCWPLRPVLLLVSFPRSRSPVVGVPGLCWMWRDVPFARQWRPVVGILGAVLVVVRGRLTVFVVQAPLSTGRLQPASLCFRVPPPHQHHHVGGYIRLEPAQRPPVGHVS